MTPRAVVFDLFETLVTEAHTNPPRAGQLGPRFGLDPVAFRREWAPRRREIVLGRRSFADTLRDICLALGGTSQPDVARVREERMVIKAAALRYVEPRILLMLDALRARATRLAVVSNCFFEDVASWHESPLCQRIDATVFSFQEGLAKPDREIYAAALRRLDVTPAQAVFVGDGGDGELAGAASAGLAACHATWYAVTTATPDGVRRFRAPEDVLTLP